jgi:hypothetical protein
VYESKKSLFLYVDIHPDIVPKSHCLHVLISKSEKRHMPLYCSAVAMADSEQTIDKPVHTIAWTSAPELWK